MSDGSAKINKLMMTAKTNRGVHQVEDIAEGFIKTLRREKSIKGIMFQ